MRRSATCMGLRAAPGARNGVFAPETGEFDVMMPQSAIRKPGVLVYKYTRRSLETPAEPV